MENVFSCFLKNDPKKCKIPLNRKLEEKFALHLASIVRPTEQG